MSALRQQMIAAMQQRGLAVRTQQSYLNAVYQLTAFFNRSPDTIDAQEIQLFFDYLVQGKSLSASSCRVYLHGIRFFYLRVLNREEFSITWVMPRRPIKIPELLTQKEISKILSVCDNPKHRILLSTCYGCGLRVSELVALKTRDIDGERKLLRVTQGKGNRDRAVVLSDQLLSDLRQYWCSQRPHNWLFPGADPNTALSIQSAQRLFKQRKARAAIDKAGGIHSLRHAYATHQLQAGMPLNELQHQLGHSHIRTTLRYVHWVPNCRQNSTQGTDLMAMLGALS